MSHTPTEKLTPQERERMAELQETMNSNRASKIEQQIAEAELNDLHISKGREANDHTNTISSDKVERSGNMFHNDEAFERYEMGGNQKRGPGGHSRPEEAAFRDYKSIGMNHKTGGNTKRKAKGMLSDSLDHQL